MRAAGLEAYALRIWRAAQPLVEVPGAHTAAPRDLKGATIGLIGSGRQCACIRGAPRASAGKRPGLLRTRGARRYRRRQGHPRFTERGIGGGHRVAAPRPHQKHSTFLGAAELAKLRPGTVLINVARGALIEPTALLARLRQGDIFACLAYL